VTELASQTKHDVQAQARSAVASGKSRAVDTISGVSQSLRSSAKQMRDQHQEGIAQYVDAAGQQVQRVADYLRDRDVNQLASETEQFARRQPAVFLGSAFALGFLGARFLKSSHRQEQHDQELEMRRASFNTPAPATGTSYRTPPAFDRERAMPNAGTGPADTWPTPAAAGTGTSSSFGATGATGSRPPGRTGQATGADATRAHPLPDATRPGGADNR